MPSINKPWNNRNLLGLINTDLENEVNNRQRALSPSQREAMKTSRNICTVCGEGVPDSQQLTVTANLHDI